MSRHRMYVAVLSCVLGVHRGGISREVLPAQVARLEMDDLKIDQCKVEYKPLLGFLLVVPRVQSEWITPQRETQM